MQADPFNRNCGSRKVLDRIGDRWSVLVVLTLADGDKRYGELAERVDGISQKMLTQTVRAMERDGLLIRTVHPVIPPRVEYRLTELGGSLAEAFCGVWVWAARNLDHIEASREAFDARAID